MAKKSVCNRELKKVKTCKRYAEKRKLIKAALQLAMKEGDIENFLKSQAEFQQLPRNASPSRITRRCKLTGRSHGNYRKFGLSRIKLREHAMRGEVPGLKFSSW